MAGISSWVGWPSTGRKDMAIYFKLLWQRNRKQVKPDILTLRLLRLFISKVVMNLEKSLKSLLILFLFRRSPVCWEVSLFLCGKILSKKKCIIYIKIKNFVFFYFLHTLMEKSKMEDVKYKQTIKKEQNV